MMLSSLCLDMCTHIAYMGRHDVSVYIGLTYVNGTFRNYFSTNHARVIRCLADVVISADKNITTLLFCKADEKCYRGGSQNASYLCDKLHSFNDRPAVQHDSYLAWYKKGLRHRDSKDTNGESLPAMVFSGIHMLGVHGEIPPIKDKTSYHVFKDECATTENVYAGKNQSDDNLTQKIHAPSEWLQYGVTYRRNYPTIDHIASDYPHVVLSPYPLCLQWYRNGELHSFNDQPAAIMSDALHWYQIGAPHRGPAPDGTRCPAVVHRDGICEYWINGKRGTW